MTLIPDRKLSDIPVLESKYVLITWPDSRPVKNTQMYPTTEESGAIGQGNEKERKNLWQFESG
jgi:hypothetical protein